MNAHLDSSIPPTVVILDVDGVIAPIHGHTAWGDDAIAGHLFGPVLVSPAMCAALDNLAAHPGLGFFWLTDWTADMRAQMDPFPGRDWPTIADPDTGPELARDWADDLWPVLPWWKWWALDWWLAEHRGVHRLVWIDDHVDRYQPRDAPDPSPSRRAWTLETALRTGAGIDALVLSPDKHTGLRPLGLRAVSDWILGIH